MPSRAPLLPVQVLSALQSPYSSFLIAREKAVSTCKSSTVTGKLTPEQVFTIKARKGVSTKVHVDLLTTNGGTSRALLDARWGGACPGTNAIKCNQNIDTTAAGTGIEWKTGLAKTRPL